MRLSTRRLGALSRVAANREHCASASVCAPVKVWTGDGADSSWSTPENWLDGVAPTTDEAIVFRGEQKPFAYNDIDALIVHSITFEDGALPFTLAGNPITLCSGITNLSRRTQTILLDISISGEHVINTQASNILISGHIVGPGKLIKTGHYGLCIGNIDDEIANTYTGGTVILEGTLKSNQSELCFGYGEIAINGAGATLFLLCSTLNNPISNNVFSGRLVLANADGTTLHGNITVNEELVMLVAGKKHKTKGKISGKAPTILEGIGKDSGLTVCEPLSCAYTIKPTDDTTLIL